MRRPDGDLHQSPHRKPSRAPSHKVRRRLRLRGSQSVQLERGPGGSRPQRTPKPHSAKTKRCGSLSEAITLLFVSLRPGPPCPPGPPGHPKLGRIRPELAAPDVPKATQLPSEIVGFRCRAGGLAWALSKTLNIVQKIALYSLVDFRIKLSRQPTLVL